MSSVVMNWYRNIDRTKFQFDFIVFNDGPLREEIECLGGNIYVLPTLRQSPINYYLGLQKIFKGRRIYNGIHVHNSFKNGVMLWLAKKAKINVRVCHSHTSGVENKWLLPIFYLLRKLVLSASSVWLACGKNAGDFLYQHRHYYVINNAITVERFLFDCEKLAQAKQASEKYHLPKNKKIIVHVGRFSQVKNHHFLLALAMSDKLNEQCHFVCIGDGPLKSAFQGDIRKHDLESRFSLLPANNDIPALLACADIFVMPSLFEGVSVAMLEAQAASLPCIVSNTIATEADMQLNLVSFLPLDEPTLWVDKLNETIKVALSPERCLNAFDRLGYSTAAVIKQITSIYLSKPSHET
ncbi:glycosyltransferase [Colwellia maritima]